MSSGRKHIVRAEFERRQCLRAKLSRLGWHEIRNDEVKLDPLFEDFWAKFFPDGWPDGLQMPSPFITWDVSHVAKLSHESTEKREAEIDLRRKCLAVLKRNSDGGPWFMIENVQHAWYRIHLDEVPEDFEDWPIDLLPTFDPCYLVSHDFSCGIFSQIYDSISVFGKSLLDDVNRSLPVALTNIRQSGLDCEE